MRSVVKHLAMMVVLVCLPAVAYAQATLSGTVRDPSGAVLPGVSVDASSPALIEKVRSAVTDGSGQYRITELPPGSYVLRAFESSAEDGRPTFADDKPLTIS